MNNKLKIEGNMFSPLVEKIVAGVVTAGCIAVTVGLMSTYTAVTAIQAFADEGDRFTASDYEKHQAEVKEYRKEQALEVKEIKKAAIDTKVSIVKIEALMSKQLQLMERQYNPPQ